MSHTPIDLNKLRSIGYLSKGRTRPKVKEYRDNTDGHRIKETVDECGGSTIEHDTPDDRVDAIIRPRTIEMDIQVNS
jgi:hypothetical protein